jgi:hypothetical protein
MSNVELPRATDRRLTAEDFRSDAFRRDAIERDAAEAEVKAGRGVNLEEFEAQLQRRPISNRSVDALANLRRNDRACRRVVELPTAGTRDLKG